MPIIHENPPDQCATAADSVAAYLAYAGHHPADASAWSADDVAGFTTLTTRLRKRVHQTGPDTWTLFDETTGEEMRFSTCVAAADWLLLHPAVSE
ncbi:hypothetical protein ACEZCY_14445 [Streptacidiphilus sp. N1-12]|uniref:Uncharacterized protein n=2 Tax=Streptacidiphilus alkalitolerans TaxID=3342712 RepID=A0ABV6V9Q9_9ACTN